MLLINQMIYQNAKDGSGGFAIDEFNPEGVWNKRLLTKSATLVMKDEATKELMGAAIIGTDVNSS